MVQSDVFADAQYIGPAVDSEPEIIVDVSDQDDGPIFCKATAIPAENTSRRVTTTYTVPPPPDMYHMKRKRKRKVLRNGLIGGAVGLLVCGPFGALLVGLGTAHVTKQVCKKKERQRLHLYETKVAQQAAVAVSMERHPHPVPKASPTTQPQPTSVERSQQRGTSPTNSTTQSHAIVF